jgi:Mannosyl-3-phosphoglycerate synthase (osmo_MPGsynth).
MRLERPHRTERFGAVRVHELQRVIELDSSSGPGDEPVNRARPSLRVSQEAIHAIERDMVIVVPCMNETRKVIEGVLSGVPHDLPHHSRL